MSAAHACPFDPHAPIRYSAVPCSATPKQSWTWLIIQILFQIPGSQSCFPECSCSSGMSQKNPFMGSWSGPIYCPCACEVAICSEVLCTNSDCQGACWASSMALSRARYSWRYSTACSWRITGTALLSTTPYPDNSVHRKQLLCCQLY